MKIKPQKRNIIIIIAIIFAVGFSFYWFQIRPSEIKKNCINEIESTSGSGAYQQFLKETGGINLESPEINGKYKTCLAKHGI